MRQIRWTEGSWALLVILGGAAGLFLIPAAVIAMLLDLIFPWGGARHAK